MAIEPIQRYCESGEKVPCWKTVGVAFGLRISYHRTPTLLPAVTEWLTTSDSWSPKFRYASRNISRSPRDRKSTRLNSSHGYISYAVFCLKKKSRMHFVFTVPALDYDMLQPNYILQGYKFLALQPVLFYIICRAATRSLTYLVLDCKNELA